MSHEMTKAMLTAPIDSPTAKLVAVILGFHHNALTGQCNPSIASIAATSALSERSVMRAIADLEKSGHLTARRRHGAGSFYHLHPCHTVTSETQSPVTQSHHTSDTESPDPCHRVTTPVTQCHPNKERTEKEQGKEQGSTLNGSGFALESDSDIEPVASSPHPEPKKKKAAARGTLEEITAFCRTLGLPASDAESIFHKWEGNGWTNGPRPIKDWQATIRSWKAAGYLPSQKAASRPGAFQPANPAQKKESAAATDLRARRRAAIRQLYPDAAAEADYADLTLAQRSQVDALLTA